MPVSLLSIERIKREDFVKGPHTGPDRFAGTFKAKADLLDLWPHALGITDGDRVAGAIVIKVNTRAPVANLQLLHTFADYRKQGIARRLVLHAYALISDQAKYFRVSSEHDAQDFYRKLGLKFWGEQKSGSLLCAHKITCADPAKGDYRLDDTLRMMLYSHKRGTLVKRYDFPR
jgi:GNAT superfamily N-acetyltransferase